MTGRNSTEALAPLLAAYGIHPAKRYGQHFLMDRRHLVKLLQPKELQQVETILEVGPGPGNLTQLLLETGKHVLAVEIDERYVRLLRDRFAGRVNLDLLHADVLGPKGFSEKVLSALARTWADGWALVANLPYRVASTVIVETLHLPVRPVVMCVMVQKEVARRLRSRPRSKDYSALSVLAQAYATVELVGLVPAGSFWPRPKVDSAIVKLVTKRDPGIRDAGHLRVTVNAMFRHRRKTLRSGFLGLLGDRQRQVFERALAELGLDSSARAEQFGIEDFINISNMSVTGCKVDRIGQ